MQRFPVVCRHHLNGVPWTSVEEGAVRTFSGAFLTTYAEVWVDLDPPEWRVIFVGHPEHAGFDWTVFYTGRRACAAGAAISGNCQYARPFLPSCFTVADRHWPMFFNDVVHA
ncbi:MAG TPA: hypothetical protein VE135_05990 [Pyrinomonadaceae bacterium]|nr:hypothetical protein [Pyrinomonadaceae bacterium]